MKSNTFQLILISLLISINCFEYIKYTEEDKISIITISRPKALNALNSQVLDELSQALDAIDTSKISALIITGDGEKSFVAGADISEMSSLSKKEAEDFSKKGNDVFRKIETFEIPVIAAINGYALGGGCEISLSCDIRICSDNAIFGQPEVGLGITPGFGGTQRLSRTVGIGMAKQMIFTGQNIKADEALRIGLVNAVYPQKELINEAKKLALSISKNSKNAVKLSKKAINDGLQVDIEKGIKIEERLFGECFENPDQKERMKNFLEKGKKKDKKNLRTDEDKKEEKEEEELPKGELVPTDKFKYALKMNVDNRGSFTELVHTEDCGQVSINISKPGITKGQHWHNSKWELFIVVAGHGLIQERNINTGETVEFEVSGEKIEAIHMIPGWTHNIINLSDTQDLVTVMTCNEIFNNDKPDTFFEEV